MNALLKPSLAEFLGTFTLVFIGGLAGSVTNQTGSLLPAIAHGFILVAIIYSYGHISGAHVNPAVTAGLLVGGKVKIDRAIAYWIAQFAGAIVAAIVMSIILPPGSLTPEYVGGAAAAQTKGLLTDTAVWSAALLEFFLTGLLVTTVYQTAVYEKVGNMAGLAIGLTLAGSIVAGGAFSGGSLNPARTLGPALIAGDLTYVIPYFVAMFAAAIVAGLLHSQYFRPEAPAVVTGAKRR